MSENRVILAVADYYKTHQNRAGRKKGYSALNHRRKSHQRQERAQKTYCRGLFGDL